MRSSNCVCVSFITSCFQFSCAHCQSSSVFSMLAQNPRVSIDGLRSFDVDVRRCEGQYAKFRASVNDFKSVRMLCAYQRYAPLPG